MKTAEKASHTPGPWREYAPEIWNDDHTALVADENYRTIEAGHGYLHDDIGFAVTGFIRPVDAALLAAAPEMLQALEAIVDALFEFDLTEPQPEQALDHMVEIAKAAIRKAKGEL